MCKCSTITQLDLGLLRPAQLVWSCASSEWSGATVVLWSGRPKESKMEVGGPAEEGPSDEATFALQLELTVGA